MKNKFSRLLILAAMMMLVTSPIYATPKWGSDYFEDASNFDAYSMGNGKIHFKVLIYAEGDKGNYCAGRGDKSKDESLTGTRIWTQLAGSEDKPLFIHYWGDNTLNKAEGYNGRPRDMGHVWFKIHYGVVEVTNSYDGVSRFYSDLEQEFELDIKRADQGDHLTYFEFNWYPPVSMDQQTFEVAMMSDHHKWGGEDYETREYHFGNFVGADPDQAPMLSDPFFYVANENGAAGYGMAALVYTAMQDVERYKTSQDGTERIITQNSDIIFAYTTDQVQYGFYASIQVHRSTDSTLIWMNTNKVNIPAYHQIHDFSISGIKALDEASGKWFMDYRKKQLTWKIYYPKEPELMENDMFEIQRAYRSDYSDATTIELVPMEYDSLATDTLDQQTYTYLDTVEAAWWNPVEKSQTIYYRVRRVSSAQWGWTGHNYAMTQTYEPSHKYSPWPFSNKLSYRLADDFETSHRVNFTFYLPNMNYNSHRTESAPGYSRYYVDPKQRFMLRKIFKELGDTIDVEIPRDSVQKAVDVVKYHPNDTAYYSDMILVRYSDIASTPCVHYQYEVYIDTTGVIVHNDSINYGIKPVNPARTKDSVVYFTEAANINTFSATKLTYSDGVLLTWQLTEGNIGSYKIETRPAGKDTAWTVLEEDYGGSWYMDKTANPFVSPEWEYRLTMTYACNGNMKSVDATAVGSRNPYGKISGYIRYEDGSACPGITVTASRTSTGATVQTVETDEYGYYLLDSLIYGEGYAYSIQPTSMSAQFRYNNTDATSATITLGLNGCIRENVNFANISSVRFSGRVLYENSTVPARDVNFLLNGIPVKSGTALYKTDASGNFEFRVPEKTPFTIQAYKEGHTFLGDGYVRMLNEETGLQDSVLSLDKAKDGVRIYDQTKVRLIGRLAGGRIQAEKPLGFGLSRNNLGDDLKMVFELEGDNISQIVHYTDDLARDSVLVKLRHEVRNGDKVDSVGMTRNEYYKKRIIIYPDVNTGEYYVDLFPVKYKITQATARGYATLYAEGKTSETLDLTNAPLHQLTNTMDGKEVDYNEAYNITYHSPISISCTQLQFGMPVDYYGEKTMKRQNIQNEKIEVPLAEKQADGTYSYLFGAPVFEMGKYQFQVTAHEDYYYNNEPTSPQHEEVRLQGGTLKVYNGMHDAINTEIQTHELDTLGQTIISIPVDYVSFIKTGEDALRVLDLSVEYQGAYVESQAVRAFVAGNKEKGQDFTASTHGEVILLDILRDPPGSGSSAYLDAGTSYNYDYTYDINLKFGVDLALGYGTDLNYVIGSWAGVGGGIFIGTPVNVSNTLKMSIPIVGEYYYKHSGSYSFTTTERITTGSDPLSVGAPSDVFIGATQNVIFGLTDAVKPIDSLTYATLSARMANKSMRVVAEGSDNQGEKYYLVIGTEMGSETYINSTFTYTQDYIENTLLSQLVQQRDALLMTGDSATVAAIAKSTKKPAYWSKVSPEEENFAMPDYYVQILPDSKVYADEVAAYNRQIIDWTGLLIRNEEEKIAALRGSNGKLVGTWSVGGSTTVSHNESYTYANIYSDQLLYPGVSASVPALDMTKIASLIPDNLAKLVTDKYSKASSSQDPFDFMCKTQGASWKFSFTPVADFSYNRNPASNGTGHTKSTGFTLNGDNFAQEYMNVSVYRVEDKKNGFNESSDGTRGYVEADDYIYGSYVYFLNGGATRCPWEGPDSTRFYTPKTPLSAGTLKLENPKLDLDVHERSNVPIDQPAVFNLRLTNESEVPYQSVDNMPLPFTLKLQRGTNPKGAKIMIDGEALLEQGREMILSRNDIQFKRVEVYAGEGYDFENITLSLVSNCSLTELARCTFSVHYMPVACPVNISAPHSNWIMNTLSPQDSTGWYLPVVIDGFDVNYKNFDHIEFQYKLSTHSDDDWVNLCSYYADDSLYNAASGNKEMITSGRIENIHFYGERDPMEQQYDLRAVAFCRHGNGFITRPSAVMRGMKDTRVPRVFGEPEPANAILGVGDNLLLRFNEPIAGNYLDEDNNFQLVGYTNETGIATGISLHFIDSEKSYAESKVMRSISDKSFTVDMMIRPENPNAAYTFFEYKTQGGRPFTFGKTDDNRLYAKLGKGIIYSDTLPEKMIPFTRIAVVYDRENKRVRFYAGSLEVTDPKVAPFTEELQFSGSAPVCLGKGFAGNMMEVRLWSKALAPDEITQTNMTRLTGYERELVAYYPMSEGTGTTVEDKANGATLYTFQTSWEYQKGISLRVTDGQVVKMNDALLSRSDKQDETLMFWFKSPRKRGTIFSAGRMSDTQGTELSFSNGALVLKNYANEWTIDGNYGDNIWHHFAMTINRTFNHVSVYVDDKQKLSFAATKMGEVSGEMYLGGNDFDGNIDEFVIFEQALPQSLMETYGTISPMGDEMGLVAYLPFVEMKENESGSLEQVFSINDQRIVKVNGEVVKTVVPLLLSVSDSTDLMELGDRTLSAPVQDIGQLTKMNFDWSFNNDELMINLNMRDREINKQTIYVTVRDVEDLNGNPMASPVTWTTFVDRNALKWEKRDLEAYAVYGMREEPIERTIRIFNNSGKRHQYTVESLPEWLTIDAPYGVIEPTDEITLELSMKVDMAAGIYTDIIYLTDENGLSEPLRIELTIEALPPYDGPDEGLYTLNMSVCAQVMLTEMENGQKVSRYDTDPNDIVYAFYRNVVVGKENVMFNETNNKSKIFMTVFGSDEMNLQPIRFQLWQASTGKVYDLFTDQDVLFKHGFVYNCGEEQPLVLTTSGSETQNITLKQGWNWISLNLDLTQTGGAITACVTAKDPWEANDLIKNPNTRQFSQYDVGSGNFVGSLTSLHYSQIYMFYCTNGNTLRISGEDMPEDSMKITVRGDGQWSVMPCLFDRNTPVSEALAAYYDNATPGDLIKAHNRFATFSTDKRWEGNLTTLKPGEGYLFRRMASGAVTIPFYKQANNAAPQKNTLPSRNELEASTAFTNSAAATNMTMIATISYSESGLTGKAGQTLRVFIGDELVGRADPISLSLEGRAGEGLLYFLTIQSDKTGALRFETGEGETLVPSSDNRPSYIHRTSYIPDTHLGSLEKPVVLTPMANANARAYKLIENDHVVIIRNGEKYDVTGKKL